IAVNCWTNPPAEAPLDPPLPPPLTRTHQPRVTRHICGQDGGETADRGHSRRARLTLSRILQKPAAAHLVDRPQAQSQRSRWAVARQMRGGAIVMDIDGGAPYAAPAARGTDGLRTHRWREMDSNRWFRDTNTRDFRSIPGIARIDGAVLNGTT